jgi:hypothetical protein
MLQIADQVSLFLTTYIYTSNSHRLIYELLNPKTRSFVWRELREQVAHSFLSDAEMMIQMRALIGYTHLP